MQSKVDTTTFKWRYHHHYYATQALAIMKGTCVILHLPFPFKFFLIVAVFNNSWLGYTRTIISYSKHHCGLLLLNDLTIRVHYSMYSSNNEMVIIIRKIIIASRTHQRLYTRSEYKCGNNTDDSLVYNWNCQVIHTHTSQVVVNDIKIMQLFVE